ncbi:4-hydroxybenzoate polyprenyltransferase [Halohasta litchfieldiae]|jgi:4-hydroxybenzoate polyprenyltransferase|uniref:4-hydroxybenzoate polyprenyltransferase n=1 Tax=Halohasta litchfieldiae TaxID=1073996 RepID=A0A1H6X4V6_9EURY|nr:prenyltransferase [Halohasta litchfieldiae]ATW87281.1 4-hydroxybenzoate polyprenyltransferase [Halohasta litchfieldiae]SEJ24108.1 4-hydroxybenzoate polyprenyltransferase [Halohasta litchfieldiae]
MSSVTTDEQADSGLVDRLSYLVALSRPRFWFYLAGPVVVGVAVAATSVDELFGSTAVALFAYFLLPANVLLYGVNDIFDAEVDTENPKKDDKEVRWQGDRSVTAAVVLSGLLGVGLLGVTPPAAWPWLVGFLFLAVEYSAPPLRFKTTPLLDSVSNGLYILPGIAAYVVVAGGQPPALAVVGAWLWTMGMHTFSAIPDIEPDRQAGIRTTATALGERRTYGYVAGCWLAASLAFGLVDLRLGGLLAVYPVFVVWVTQSSVAVDRAYWWFPALNTAVGTLITLGALWQLVPVWEVLP